MEKYNIIMKDINPFFDEKKEMERLTGFFRKDRNGVMREYIINSRMPNDE